MYKKQENMIVPSTVEYWIHMVKDKSIPSDIQMQYISNLEDLVSLIEKELQPYKKGKRI